MRLWSLHPEYLDTKGLLALWREALLAKKVLEGKIKGYKNHPQLLRFKNHKYPLKLINSYLFNIYLEAKRRGFSFDRRKIRNYKLTNVLPVTSGQVEFEFLHLKKKLLKRDKNKYIFLKHLKDEDILLNPIFYKIQGSVERWEKGGLKTTLSF